MRPPLSILVYGRDIHLIETRRWVLEHAGFAVSTTLELRDAEDRIDADHFDLFILCHTLSAEECTSILANVHSRHPEMKILILSRSRPDCGSKDDFVLSAFATPQALISTVSGLISMPVAAA
ncbi:MAG TPA: hypothetical protein VGU23_09315 [Acidobacteriaceae bacterium]|nr:hypothetical protein [Acidobacteriaceae bacterium]